LNLNLAVSDQSQNDVCIQVNYIASWGFGLGIGGGKNGSGNTRLKMSQDWMRGASSPATKRV
jgi:hypothetical protein